MASDYDEITTDNIRRRGEDFEDIGRFLAEKLYGDRSHFIYELLQNAEDALARRRQDEPTGDFPCDVKFKLCKDHLEVSHYGKPFDENDVRAICDVMRGTKNERIDQIGTFGIGFKSVYAFTDSPEIHSGNEHFVIEKFIRPKAVPPRDLDDPQQTLFYFPFDHPAFSREAAFELIQVKLCALGARSLLFLNYVKDLLWIIEGVGRGLYMRECQPNDKGGSFVQILGEGTGQKDTEEDWLIVHRDVQRPTRSEKLAVKIAYSLKKSGDSYIVKHLPRSPLTVFFPTAQETGLAFLIHGPFASTPARDNIQSDSSWNELLISELSCLIADSLEICKNHGLLTADFLPLLPITSDAFPPHSTFRPIYDAVLSALTSRPLIPTADGGHAAATEVVLGRAQDLRDLLPQEVLQDLLGVDCGRRTWVDGSVTDSRLPKVWQYLRDECDVLLLDGEAFARRVTSSFLDARSEEWMVQFYSFLSSQEALWRPKPKSSWNYPPEGVLRRKAFIRCEDGVHRAPFDATGLPCVFLPVHSDVECNIVGRSIYIVEKAAEFFRRLGLVEPDICTQVVNNILPLYRAETRIEHAEHAKHVDAIRDAMALKESPQYPEMIQALKATPWVLAHDSSCEKKFYAQPTRLFFRIKNLEIFFEGNPDVRFLAENDDLDWPFLGVRRDPVVNCRGLSVKTPGYVPLISAHGWHKRGVDGFDPESSIDGLKHALETISLDKAAFIWNDLLPPLVRFLRGKYQSATHQNYDNATTYEVESDLCKMLKSHAWIPAGSGFKRPSECVIDEIAAELQRNETLFSVLGIQSARNESEHLKELFKHAGLPPELSESLVQNLSALTPDLTEKLKRVIDEHVQTRTTAIELPERPVPDRDRRAARVGARIGRADPKTYDARKRSVRLSRPNVPPKVWLKEMYTNRQGIMVCQICCEPMPFKLPITREYYFEAVQVSDHFSREDHCLYLALCPLCAAKYNVFVKKDEECLKDFIRALEQSGDGDYIIPAKLDEPSASVRFVEAHLLDLKTALFECLTST